MVPPPWLEFTTSDPSFSTTRVRPPGATRTPAGLDRTKGLRSTCRGDRAPPFNVGADQAAAPASGLFPAIGLALAAVALALALRK